MKIKVINGPNLNLLGVRKPEIYGHETLKDLEEVLRKKGEALGVEMHFFQSNHEGDLIDSIQDCLESVDGVILNAGAYSHYSYGIRDAIEAISKPVVEVHISNIFAREESFRHESVLSSVCIGVITGFGFLGYELGLEALINEIKGRESRS